MSWDDGQAVRYIGPTKDNLIVQGSMWTVVKDETRCGIDQVLCAHDGGEQLRCIIRLHLRPVYPVRVRYSEVCPANALEVNLLEEITKDTPRGSVLIEARELIDGDRNNSYGPPTQDFQRTAGIMNALGYRGPDGREIEPHDVAIIISAVKLSRLMWTPGKRDNWVDLAGYAGCGYECAVEEGHVTGSESGKDSA